MDRASVIARLDKLAVLFQMPSCRTLISNEDRRALSEAIAAVKQVEAQTQLDARTVYVLGNASHQARYTPMWVSPDMVDGGCDLCGATWIEPVTGPAVHPANGCLWPRVQDQLQQLTQQRRSEPPTPRKDQR